jgi:hypothetical protein
MWHESILNHEKTYVTIHDFGNDVVISFGSCQSFFYTSENYGIAAGCAVAQAVSQWLPTVTTHVPTQARSFRIYGAQSSTGAVFLDFGFPCQTFH